MAASAAAQLLAALLCIAPAHAADHDEESMLASYFGDEEMVSIATGTPVALSRAPSVATVITAADIKAMGATTLQEALEQVPGLHVSHSLWTSMYSIRGIHTQQNPQVLILRNGQEIHELMARKPVTGQHFAIEAVKRIEVIRGPGSAIYGADAFAGVINIITKDADDIDGSEFGMRAGSFNYIDAWGQYGGEVASGWKLAATVQYSHSDGDGSRIVSADTQSLFDSLFSTSASNAPGPWQGRYKALTTDFTLHKGNWTSHLHTDTQRDVGQGPGVARALDPDGRVDSDQYLFDLNYHEDAWRPHWSLDATFRLHYASNDFLLHVFPAGASLPIGSDGNLDITSGNFVTFSDGYIGLPGRTEITSNLDLTTIYSGMEFHTWRFNAGIKIEDFEARERKNFGPGVIDGSVSPIDGTLTSVTDTPDVYMPDTRRTIRYLSVQDEWDFAPDWNLTTGVRFDRYSDFGSTVNPRVSLVWNARRDLTVKLLYGSAFRAPSTSELYSQNNPVALGNPDLQPETIDTYELAFDYQISERLNVDFNVFHYEISDLIELVDEDGLPGGRSLTQNNRDQVGRGFEIEARWKAGRNLDVNANFAMQRAEDAASGERIADAPGRQAFVGCNWRFLPGWSVNAQLQWVADRRRATGDTRSQIADYTLTNLTLRHATTDGLDLGLKIANLFDEDAREPAPASVPNDFPLPGRSVWLEARAHF